MTEKILKNIILFFLRTPEGPFKKIIRNIFYGEIITERIVEYPVFFSHIEPKPSRKVKVLDIGCYYSNFPIQLASMGYSVVGVDLQDYELTHPNFRFLKGDINRLKIKGNFFDIVTSISTIEHIGLGVYGDEKDEGADAKAINKIHKLLKKGGTLMISVPFGVKNETSSYRVYDFGSIIKLLSLFQIEKMLYFIEKKGKWLPASLKEASKVRSLSRTRAFVFVKAKKV